MLKGSYSEDVKYPYVYIPECSSSLEVSANGWRLLHIIPGKDRRHNSRFEYLSPQDIVHYIAQINEAWNRYEEAACRIGELGNFWASVPGPSEVNFCLGGAHGLYLDSPGVRLRTRDEVDEVILFLDHIGDRGQQIRDFLQQCPEI